MSDSGNAIRDLQNAKRWSEALLLIETELTAIGPSRDLLWNAGWCNIKMERYSEAAAYLRRATDVAPADPVSRWALSVALTNLGELDEAELSLLRALALGDSTMARTDLGLLYQRRGWLAVAEQVHLEGLRLKPNDRGRREAYSDFLSEVGRGADAKRVLDAP